MSIFAKGSAELEELKTSNSQLTAQLEQITGTNEQLAGQLSTALSRLETLEASHKQLSESFTASQEEIGKLKAENKSLETRAEVRAQEIVAKLGVEAVPETKETVTNPTKTKEQLLAEYAAIQDPKAKNDFYQKHLAPISQFRSK